MYRSTFEYDRGKVDMSFVVDNLPLNIFLEFIKELPNNNAINTLSASTLILKEHARELAYLMDKLRLKAVIARTTDPEINVGILSVIYRNEDDLLVVLEAIISLLRRDLDPIDVKALAMLLKVAASTPKPVI